MQQLTFVGIINIIFLNERIKVMFKTILKIEGMRCSMCEAHINDVIRKTVPDAKKVKSSHKKGESVFASEQEPDKSKLRKP